MRRRIAWLSGYVGGSAIVAAIVGLGSVGRPAYLVWSLGLVWLIGWRNPNPIARTAFDWLPLLVILAAYDLVRANASSLIPRAHLEPMIWFDEVIGFGIVPTVRLQDALFDAANPGWFDYACLLVYVSHFFAAITVGAVVYFRARARFAQYAFTFLVCSLAGFATYVIYPAIPPWMASEQGAIPPTVRAPDVLWEHLGLGFLSDVFSGDPEYSNPVGALPSEHAAYPLLFLLLFWAATRSRGRAVLVAYVVAMAFVLVYFAEHYVFDILMGWVYAAVSFVVVARILDRRHPRPAVHEPEPAQPPPVEPDVEPDVEPGKTVGPAREADPVRREEPVHE